RLPRRAAPRHADAELCARAGRARGRHRDLDGGTRGARAGPSRARLKLSGDLQSASGGASSVAASSVAASSGGASSEGSGSIPSSSKRESRSPPEEAEASIGSGLAGSGSGLPQAPTRSPAAKMKVGARIEVAAIGGAYRRSGL